HFATVLPDEHFQFLMDLKTSYQQEQYFFVHAGLHPDKPLEVQTERDLLWIRDEFFDEGEGQFPDIIIVHGHTPVKRPDNLSWRINVDTGAVWSGKLTAAILEPKKRYFVST
ncbi:MAG: serine/threonine protein phosphatase, partial [Pseudomonadota bacterium]